MYTIVFTKDSRVWSPRMPFCHKISSSSKVIDSAFQWTAPIPADCKRFISASNTIRNCEKPESLKISIWGIPFVRKYLIMLQQMWWSVFGTNKFPSFFFTSKTNAHSQCWSSSAVILCSKLLRLSLHGIKPSHSTRCNSICCLCVSSLE